jgi:thiol-disulfide isomerase/thioredoxin
MVKSLQLQVSEWLNTPSPLAKEHWAGKVVMVEAFQMLCPGCVNHSLPQAKRVQALFADSDLVVIGLHTVFEHHNAQGQTEVLKAFLHEYRITFPIAIDAPSEHDPLPQTMRAYDMQGTPSLLLFDRDGELVVHHFGAIDDLSLGATIANTLCGPSKPTSELQTRTGSSSSCESGGCTR